MSAVLHDIWTGLRGATALDQANLVLGVAGVILMIRRTLLAFPVGLVAVFVQGVLFYQARYYADATLQVIFFAALAYGWWHWVRDRGAAPELPVTRLSNAALLGTVAAAGAATLAWGAWLRGHTDAVMPFRDAFIASFSVAGQILQARKKLENWPCWTIANIVAIASYWAGGLFYTAFLYAIYLGLGLAGWRAWAKAPAREAAA
jgi:nicotinamide mononucleotide transporter